MIHSKNRDRLMQGWYILYLSDQTIDNVLSYRMTRDFALSRRAGLD